MISAYNNRKDPDGFLYLTYAQETVFGSDACRVIRGTKDSRLNVRVDNVV